MIGREFEKSRLLSAYASNESEFVAVYGRRRVGKTYLVRQVFENKFTFSHTGMASKKTYEQLKHFQLSLRRQGMPDAKLPANWLEAFELLKDLVENSDMERKIIFLDEIPWMDVPRSNFLSSFEAFWNGWASARRDILLIICGSATSWIITKIIRSHGGLHNRVTYNIPLEPFSLDECEKYVKSRNLVMNRRQILETYMIVGGIPFYWSKLQKGLSQALNIDQLLFSAKGELHNEFDYLYSSLFKNPKPYIAIVTALGRKKKGMTRTELSDASGVSNNGKLADYLESLEHCGFIRKYTCLGKKNKDAVFQLIDNFTLFYFQFMENAPKDEHFWSKAIGSAAYNVWCGLAFERVCLLHIRQVKRKLGIDGVISEEYSWVTRKDETHPGAQIDLLIDRADDVIDIFEMKYSKNPYSVNEDLLYDFSRKAETFRQVTKTDKAIHYVLIASMGVARDANADEIQNIVTSDDLFAEISL